MTRAFLLFLIPLSACVDSSDLIEETATETGAADLPESTERIKTTRLHLRVHRVSAEHGHNSLDSAGLRNSRLVRGIEPREALERIAAPPLHQYIPRVGAQRGKDDLHPARFRNSRLPLFVVRTKSTERAATPPLQLRVRRGSAHHSNLGLCVTNPESYCVDASIFSTSLDYPCGEIAEESECGDFIEASRI